METISFDPLMRENRLFQMSLYCDLEALKEDEIFVYATVQWDDENPYLELNCMGPALKTEQSYYRFCLKKNYAMSLEEEQLFDKLMHENLILVDTDNFVYLQEFVLQEYPELNLDVVYEDVQANKFFDRVYYSLHRSGAKEILYKSGFSRIAYQVDRIYLDLNEDATKPEDIMGVPLKLMRILYQNELEARLVFPNMRKKESKIYQTFATFFGKENYPNRFQWQYLEEYTSFGDDENAPFRMQIYKRLKDCKWDMAYLAMKNYCCLSKRLGIYNPYKKLPKMADVIDDADMLREISKYLEDGKMERANRRIKRNNGMKNLSFENDLYQIMVPTSVMEFVEEAVNQHNCLIRYIEQVENAQTNIVFIRKKSAPKKSFVTMEICQGKMEQFYSACNELPDKSVFEFVERFCKRWWLKYDPVEILSREMELQDMEEEYEEYLNAYYDRNGFPNYSDWSYEDNEYGEQVTLMEYYPVCFAS